MYISNRKLKKIRRKVMAKMIDQRKNAYGNRDHTPYNAKYESSENYILN